VKDVIVTVNVQPVGPVGTAGVDDVPQAPHAAITVAQKGIFVHARGVSIPEDRPAVHGEAIANIAPTRTRRAR
jgi:hypothetical protein